MDTSICMDDMTLFYSIFLHGQDLVNLIYLYSMGPRCQAGHYFDNGPPFDNFICELKFCTHGWGDNALVTVITENVQCKFISNHRT